MPNMEAGLAQSETRGSNQVGQATYNPGSKAFNALTKPALSNPGIEKNIFSPVMSSHVAFNAYHCQRQDAGTYLESIVPTVQVHNLPPLPVFKIIVLP